MIPSSWAAVPIVDVLALNQNGKPFQQGWSPQCESHPAPDEKWGVLKTTAIQPGVFWDHENKQLPEHLEPRAHIEVRSGDLLMTCAGPRSRCGVVCLVEHTRPKLMMSGKMYRFRPNSEAMDAHFLAYFIQSRAAQVAIDAMKTGISDSGLNLTHDRFAALAVPIAPLNEQRRIVAKIEELFSELDKGVESLTTAREQLKAYRQSVLKHAFEGKLTEDWRLSNLAQLKNAEEIVDFVEKARRTSLEVNTRVRNKPPAPFDDIDLPECPAAWAFVSMDSLCYHITSGSRDWSRFYDRGTSTFIMAQNVRAGRYDGSVIQRVDPPMDNAETERTRVQVDDILVTIVGANTGDVCRFPLDSETHYVCQSVALMRLACPEYARFVELYFQSRSGGQRQYERYIYGAGRPHLSFEQIKQTVVPIPDPREAAQIVRTVDKVFAELDATETILDVELARSKSLQQSILNAAFSGQLVPQDASDEPASVLLERIRTEADRANKRHNTKTRKKEAA